MSVRRLAEENVQPGSFAFSNDNSAWAEATINKYPKGRQQSAVILLLMRAQEQDGWVTKAAIETVADMLDMPYIRVLEVATFYTQFQLKPVGSRAHVQVCGTTPCMLRGAEDLINLCRKRIHPNPLSTNDAGTLSWEEVECQGACVNAPMVMIFKDTYEDLTVEQLEHIIDSFDAGRGAEIKPGTQIDRIFSAPVGGVTTLTAPYERQRNQVTDEVKVVAVDAPESTPPSNAGRATTHADESNPSVKTPGTAKAEAADNALLKGEVSHTGGAETSAPVAEASPTQTPQTPASSEPAVTEPEPASTEPAPPKPSLDDENRPAAIDRPDAPDNLKLISGVGPKIEDTLHKLGIFTFQQIAGWNTAERAWVDGYLNFRGRIERDDWVRQAEALATGGEAEYVRVFGRKPR